MQEDNVDRWLSNTQNFLSKILGYLRSYHLWIACTAQIMCGVYTLATGGSLFMAANFITVPLLIAKITYKFYRERVEHKRQLDLSVKANRMHRWGDFGYSYVMTAQAMWLLGIITPEDLHDVKHHMEMNRTSYNFPDPDEDII